MSIKKTTIFIWNICLLCFVILFIKEEELYNKIYFKRIENWEQEFALKDIKEVDISFDNTFYNAKDPDMARYWKKVKKVYVNNQEVRPDKLYKKDDFIYEHCGDYYTVLTKKEIDSIVYKFPPVNRYEEYVKGKLINSTEDFYRKRKLQERLSGSLPTCDE